MSFSNDEYPIFLDKLLDEMDRCGGEMTGEQFRNFLYNIRLSNSDLENIDMDENTKKQLLRMRLDKKSVSGFKRWLNLNGYLVINHEYQKEVYVLKDKCSK